MSSYINISLDLSLVKCPLLDLRVPTSMTLLELLQTVSESYSLDLGLNNPIARQGKNGKVLTLFQELGILKNGDLIIVERL